mgnify:CR=1 FL=1
MLAEIITIGDEILIGQIIDTNSVFISKELNKIGVQVYQITSIQDDRFHILEALANARKRVDIVILTGGLGPTKDDITKVTLCDFFEDTLIENNEVNKMFIFDLNVLINVLFSWFGLMVYGVLLSYILKMIIMCWGGGQYKSH